MHRLILGDGSIGSALIDELADRPGDLVVLSTNEGRVESLRTDGVDARHVESVTVDTVRAIAGPADSVIVTSEDGDRARRLTSLARRAYPSAFVLACVDSGLSDAEMAAIDEKADRVVDTSTETGRRVAAVAGDSGIRTRTLLWILRDLDGPLAIVPHDHPDPDAIASAVALGRIADRATADSEVCYFGDITHQENRALVNLLGFDLRQLDAEADLSEFGGIALVDHSRPGDNDSLPEGTPIDVVIDHHPPRAPVDARFVDLRSHVGSTSTLLGEYLSTMDIDPGAELATGLLYGIRTDTDNFSRQVAPLDLEMAAELVEPADQGMLQRIESPSVTGDTLSVIGEAIRQRDVKGEVLTTCVGEIGSRDALAQAADALLDMEDIRITLVFGYTDEMVYVSGRTRGSDIDLGSTLRDAFDLIGSAGGHADMAGAQIPVGMLLEPDDEGDRRTVITDIVTDRFYDALGITIDRAAADVYADFFGSEFEIRE
ncbi:MAG: DHH family phosphoesterase [Natronomonas sp.]